MAAVWLATLSQQVLADAAAAADGSLGRAVFKDAHDPPSWQALDAAARARYDFGHAVFNTHWLPAGTRDAARIDGVGPLYNAGACDSCHTEGARGRGPLADGGVGGSLVVQLETPGASSAAPDLNSGYGHVLNTAAIDGLAPEATVTVRYQVRSGRYADGTAWQLRAPQYTVSDLRYGALDASTVLKPRLAPPLFGAGLLEAVPDDAILATAPPAGAAWQDHRGRRTLGRFGWQGGSVSVRDQTSKAFAREMGMGSSDIPADDCTTAQRDCRAQPNGGEPEVADERLAALLEFQRWLAVPSLGDADAVAPRGRRLFADLGCAGCHRPILPVAYTDPAGHEVRGTIAPYTDLLLHDLGPGLADVDLAGRSVPTRWRTAPLWAVAYTARAVSPPTLLHDGRARTVEEAILWHDGEAQAARRGFEALPADARRELLDWLAHL
ncbi:MAG: hypothetical protein IT494_06990 [Gammaproteobacteria bacterium]|nr:hypothetical protein [Gammaproteobacteria bacterium]